MKYSILLVDDECGEGIKRLLDWGEEDFFVTLCKNGEEALDRIQEGFR